MICFKMLGEILGISDDLEEEKEEEEDMEQEDLEENQTEEREMEDTFQDVSPPSLLSHPSYSPAPVTPPFPYV